MSKKELRIAVIALAILCVISVAVMIAALIHFRPAEPKEFSPPSFDAAAVAGPLEESDALKALGWSEIYQQGMDYSARLCGRVLADEQNKAEIWFYNPADNDAWLKLRIYDSEQNIIAETGLIRPGEYLREVQFTRAMAEDEPITIKIMGYEPETYHSAGAVALNTTVKNR